MMRHTSKGLVLAGCIACAGAMRSKVDLQSSGSVVQVVDHIASLLGENVEIRRIAEAVQARSSPGVDGHFKSSLKKVVDTIDGTLQPRVQAAHEGTQKKINKVLTVVQAANRVAIEHKAAADQKDQAWFSCVAQELEKKEFHETGQEKLAAAQKVEQEACALQQKHKSFSFTAGDEYKFDFKCDNSVEGSCEEKMAAFEKHINEIRSDAKEEYEAKDKYYDDLEADCNKKRAETAAAREEMKAADDAHNSHRDKCEALKQERVKAICEYGDAVQSKGTDEAKFKQLLASVEGTGTEESEADRQKEWASLVTSSCMIKRSIAQGTQGPVSDADMKACSAKAGQLTLAKLSKQADAFKTLTESHACVAGPISFFNGEEWKEQGGADSEDYSKQAFTPALNPTDGEQPFEMCPGANQDAWRGVLLDEKRAAAR